MFKLNIGNVYTKDLISQFYLRCDEEVRLNGHIGEHTIWKKKNTLDSSRDDGERYIMQHLGKYSYRCHKIYNIKKGTLHE